MTEPTFRTRLRKFRRQERFEGDIPYHEHQADDITGGTFGASVFSGDLWSGNWDGAIPATLSSADTDATVGWYFDTSVGSFQVMGDFFLGGDLTLIGGTGLIRTAVSGQRIEIDAADLDRINYYTDFDDGGGNVETEPGYVRGEISATFGVVDFESALLVLASPEVNASGFRSSIILAADEALADIWLSFDQGGGAIHFNSDTDDLGFISETEWRVGSDAWGGSLVVYNTDDTNEGGEIVLKGPGAENDIHLDNFAGNFRIHHDSNTYFSVDDDGSSQISQRSTSSGLPVLILEQLDVDDTFINVIGTSAADGTRSISSDTTTDSAKFGAFRVEVNGVTKWVRLWDDES